MTKPVQPWPPPPAPIMSTCDDGKPIRLPDGSAHVGPPSLITPGYAEVRTSSGATHLVPNGDWHAKRRASAMARAASLTFGRPRTRGAVKA